MVACRRSGISRAEFARLHRLLVDRTAALDSTHVTAILDVGTAVIFHARLEVDLDTVLTPLLDEAVVTQLDEEHRRLTDDLALLASLREQDRDSSDLLELSSAILEHLRRHVARDQRLFYDAMERHKPPAAGLGDTPGG